MSTSRADFVYENYLRDITGFQRITSEREAELSDIIQNSENDEAVESAITELVESNLLLVVHCMKDFLKFLDSPGARLTHMDLISEGNIGLMRAARKYDATCTGRAVGSSHARFSTYACRSINNAMRRAIKLSRFIHIPEHHFRYWTQMRELEDEFGADLSDSVLQRNMGVGNAKLQMLKQSQGTGTSLLEDLTADEDSGTWNDFISDESAITPYEAADSHDLHDFLRTEITTLPDRTQSMLHATFFAETPCTYAQLSREYGVSKERCRQICAQGLSKLRERLEYRRERVTGIAHPVDTTKSAASCAPNNVVKLKQRPTETRAETVIAEEDAA